MIRLCMQAFILSSMLLAVSAAPGCTIDLGLIVDVTQSIKKENIVTVKAGLAKLVQQFGVSEDGTHVSLETFDNKSTIHNYFKDTDHHNEEAVLNLIEHSIDKLSKPTRLDLALKKADEEMFTKATGDRAGVESVMVLFTDGRSHPSQTETDAYRISVENMRQRGVRVFVFGIGPDSRKEKHQEVLRLIAGDAVFFDQDYSNIDEAINNLTDLMCPCQNSTGMDLALLVERTRSLGKRNFLLLKGFVLKLVQALSIGPDQTHAGIILFSRRLRILNTFRNTNYHSNEALYNRIDSIRTELGRGASIDRALKAANTLLFTRKGGDRPDFPNTLILFTDGRTNKASRPYANTIRSLKAKNVKIIVVGIGDYQKFQGQLEEIAGDLVFNVQGFSKISTLLNSIMSEKCKNERPGWG
ncbi:collagen alpha-3(VI) chain-like [Stylophora pistillata]|uniref:Collagen alpha-5(VI) chain n=1 Tax=Stylophora pistillata TaxID=50429 RepID=A0A2B4RW64_STYPI|nr:collagen alpha-3(VI) chain-like [Stylophora pistillata]XP_022795295.1 collagen alpha-3(VI) chain-like [Stylophora pistillata]PFX22694.1 Collagen alpha-5(VI) chain [Stylophora pistillata]